MVENKKNNTKTKLIEMRSENTKNILLECLKKNMGIVTISCQQAHCSRSYFYKLMNTNEKFREEVQDIENHVLDFVENSLLSQIKAGDTTATIFYLKCKGRKRGYIDKQEIEHFGVVGNLTGLEGKTTEELLQIIEKCKE